MLLKQKERIKSMIKLYRKRGMYCSQKVTSIPLYLKSKVQKQGQEDGRYEHQLVFLEKREESRSFDVFCVFWKRNMVKKERKKMPKQLPKCLPLQFELPGASYRPWHTFQGPTDVSNFVLIYFFIFDFGRVFRGLATLRLRKSWCPWKALDVQF